MAVADATVVADSTPVMLEESTTTMDGVKEEEGQNGQDKNIVRGGPTILESDENDPTVTITSTTSSLFANSISGFLINRRLQQGKNQSPARMASFSKNLKHVARVSSRNLNISLARSKLYNSFPNLARKENQVNQAFSIDDENVRKVLKAVESDHVVSTDGADNRNRRTVYIEKHSGIERFGFTIQSYTFRHAKTNRTEQITYVDYVDLDSPAFVAGLRAGDLILAINGRNVQSESHKQLVAYIGQCSTLRMVVLFENCVNRIELCAKAIKLKKLLADKEFELRVLNCQEQRILSGLPPFTDAEVLALLRTPCSTPRSVSFSLPSAGDSGSTTCLRRPSAPIAPRSKNVYYVNREDDMTPRANDTDLLDERDDNSVIHYMDVDDVIGTDAQSAVMIDDGDPTENEYIDQPQPEFHTLDTLAILRMKPCFVLGSEAGSSVPSSSCRSSYRQSEAEISISGDDGENPPNPEDSGHVTGDDLALIHILHIDDTNDETVTTPRNNEPSSNAITRF